MIMVTLFTNIFKKRRWVIKYQSHDSKGELELTGNYFTCILGIFRFCIRNNYLYRRKH